MKPEFTAKQMDTAINKAWIAAREEALEEAAKILLDNCLCQEGTCRLCLVRKKIISLKDKP